MADEPAKKAIRRTREVWWDSGTLEPHDLLFALVGAEWTAQSSHYNTLRRYAACYESGFGTGTESLTGEEPGSADRLYSNPAANCVDTFVASVANNRVTPMAIPEKGMQGERDRAEEWNRGVNALWEETGLDSIAIEVIRDAALYSLGAAWVYAEDGAVTAERVDPLDVLIDRSEARNGAPRCLYLRKLVDRGVLIARFGEDMPGDGTAPSGYVGTEEQRVNAILDAPAANPDDWTDANEDLLEVIFAWHLPSGKRAKDGRFVVAIRGYTLIDRQYDRPTFPIAFYRPKKSRRGYWGVPLFRSLYGSQREWENLTSKVERSHHRLGGAHILIHGSSQKGDPVSVSELTNGIGTAIRVMDGTVQEWTPTPCNPQTISYRESIADDMLRFNGISGYAARAEIPAGITGSGRAQQVYADTDNKRLVEAHEELERWTLEIAQLVIDTIEEVVETEGKYVVEHADRAGFSEIDWAELIKDRKSVRLRMFPVNPLGQTPAARFATATEWFNSGAIDQETFRRLIDIPDLAAQSALDTSASAIIDKTLYRMLSTGRYFSPEPLDNLAMIIKRGTAFYNLVRLDEKVPEERLDLIRQFVADAQALMAQAAPPPAPAQPMMGEGAPPGPPPMPEAA